MIRKVLGQLYGWRWPLGWWRLRGRARLRIGGRAVEFAGIAGSRNEWWALAVRRHAWEQPVVDAFVRAVRPGDLVYDIGAWIGPYTLLASQLAGPSGRVVAFEPDPEARAQLERNLVLNRVANVTVVPIALSARAGTARLSGGGSQATVGAAGTIEVQTMTLPDFVAREGAPDVVKVDIEGGELSLSTSALGSAREIFLEVHVPAFRAAGVDPDGYLARVAGARPVVRLEGDADNYNVRIGASAAAS